MGYMDTRVTMNRGILKAIGIAEEVLRSRAYRSIPTEKDLLREMRQRGTKVVNGGIIVAIVFCQFGGLSEYRLWDRKELEGLKAVVRAA